LVGWLVGWLVSWLALLFPWKDSYVCTLPL